MTTKMEGVNGKVAVAFIATVLCVVAYWQMGANTCIPFKSVALTQDAVYVEVGGQLCQSRFSYFLETRAVSEESMILYSKRAVYLVVARYMAEGVYHNKPSVAQEIKAEAKALLRSLDISPEVVVFSDSIRLSKDVELMMEKKS